MAIYRGPGGAGDATADATNAASIAEGFADAAASSAASASSSASTASTAATNAGNSATAAASSASAASTSASNASTSASNASTSASNASSSASTAATAQAAAELAETGAETAQAAAEAAQAAAELAETNAETAETGAVAAQTAAEAARDATLAAYDNFDDRYLGAKTSNPTLDNDGNALIAGALYFNSVAGEMRLYTGSAWVAAYVSGEGFLASANNLSDLASAATARQNLDLEIGVDVQAYDADTAKYDDATANFTGTLQNGGSNVVVDSDIGSTVQAYDSNLTSFVSAFTLPTTDGTANQVLKTDGSGNLGWATAGGGGKVLQVVQTFKSDTTSAAHASVEDLWADISGMSVTITPTSATSKILVSINLNLGAVYDGNDVRGQVIAIQILRGATAVGNGASSGSRLPVFAANSQPPADNKGMFQCCGEYLDSPATTSSTTYKLQWRKPWNVSSATIYLNRPHSDNDDNDYTRGSSSITVMEIGA